MKHRTYKYAKYGAVIVAGMLLMALPMTVMAQKNTEAAATVEIETTTEASTKALKSADKDTAISENTAAKGEESKKDKITDASENAAKTGDQTEAGKGADKASSTVNEAETKTSDTTKAEETTTSETAKDTEEETTASEKSTEDVAEESAAADESGTESKSETESETEAKTDAETETESAAETETETKTETKAAETTAAELKSEDKLASGIIGTWSVDDSTGLSFGENNKGKLIIPDEEYAFSYKLDGDQLTLDFVSSKATDGTYTASLSGDTLTLIGGKGTIGGTFELSRN